MPRLILASGSAHRRALLERLRLPFEAVSADVDESALPGEAPDAMALRLSAAKAEALAGDDAIVIGSDQVASLEGRILRKPGTAARAIGQLMQCRNRSVEFHTAVTLTDPPGRRTQTVDFTRVFFRRFDQSEVERYVALESPLDCAGGFKVEGLGIALFKRIETTDPTALIGLPLIWLAEALRALGIDPLRSA